MLSYLLRRLLLVIPTLLGITAVVFFVMALAPGGVGASLLTHEGQMNPQQRRAMEQYLNQRYGLDKPPVVQYLRWLNKVSPFGYRDRADAKRGLPWFKSPDLGESFSRQRPVTALISESLPITLLLNVVTIPIIYTIAILTGIQAAKRRGQLFDVGGGTILLGLWSLPTILSGVLLIGFLSNQEYLRLFPTNGLHDIQADAMTFLPTTAGGSFQRGWLLDTLWHLVLPVVCMSYGGFAFLSKLQRGAVLENISLDYVRTARAKGLAEKEVLYRHVFRNSLIPLITVAANLLPALLAGTVVVETIFGISGMGRLMVEAAFVRDRELVLSDALVIGLVGLIAYLLADICYVVADPRVSYDA